MSKQPIVVQEYSAGWVDEFREMGLALRRALQKVALRIDHIGSTSVHGLAAKPIIDIQISVKSLDPIAPFLEPIESVGYVWRQDNPELSKRYFREKPGARRTHIHVRELGSWHEQKNLLFRDYLRAHGGARESYALAKRKFATEFRNSRQEYQAAKMPFIWAMLMEADDWAARVGWRPAAPDV